jgi:hypothetical protein
VVGFSFRAGTALAASELGSEQFGPQCRSPQVLHFGASIGQ